MPAADLKSIVSGVAKDFEKQNPPAAASKPPAGKEQPAGEQPPPPVVTEKPAGTPAPQAAKLPVPDGMPGEKPPVVAAPPAAAATDDGIVEPKGLSKEQQAAFRDMRVKASTLAKELEELKKGGGKTADPEEIKTLRQKIAEQDALLGRFSLEATTEFKEKFEQPINRMQKQFERTLKQYGATDDVVKDALSKTGAELAKFLNDEAPHAVPFIAPILMQIDMLKQQREEAVANWKPTAEQIEQQRATQIESLTKEMAMGSLQQAVTTLESVHPLMKLTGDAAWDQVVQAHRQKAQQIITEGDLATQTESIVKGVMADTYLEMYKARVQEVQQLRAELSKFRNLSPSLNQSRIEGPAGGETKTPPNATIQDMAGLVVKKTIASRT